MPTPTLDSRGTPSGWAAPFARNLPDALMPFVDLALDLRWTWSHAADALWRMVNAELWEATRNPWVVLQDVSASKFARLEQDPVFRGELTRLSAERRAYLDAATWCSEHAPALRGESVAYFSMEFGLGEGVPLYAGGLGILAGDYVKAASDLGIPAVAVGLLFQEGYFRQRVDLSGRQREAYPYNDPGSLPIEPALAPDGGRLRVPIELPGRTLGLRVWRARVGRVDLYLLDANDPTNSPMDRGITSKLYGGGPEIRLLQEIVLGIGGWRALQALGIEPTVAHLNEGHTAFAVLERAAQFMGRAGVSFHDALWATRPGNVFTTHTPVQAGFDAFSPELMGTYFTESGGYLSGLRISLADLLGLGRRDPGDGGEPFNMAHFAVRASGHTNGVSRLHGATSRRLFAGLFPRWPEDDVPVGHVTNGVHVPSWDSRAADDLWTRVCGKGRWHGTVDLLCDAAAKLDDEALWAMRNEESRDLLEYCRRRLERQLTERGVTTEAAGTLASNVMDPRALTLGFARRFAEYKRPLLLLQDPERLARLLLDPARPVQLVVAGKAHPDDEQGKRMIADWVAFVNRPDVRHRAIFLEDYDIAVAERMVQGADVWINTPRRPWEACGTSGMKVLVNGGLNLSSLDGWWAEAWSPDVGWVMGDGTGRRTDVDDAEDLYAILEQEVVPEFHDRDARGLPRRWLSRVRASVSQLTPRFSATRMVQEYAERFYAEAATGYRRRAEDGARLAKDLRAWQAVLDSRWGQIRFGEFEVRRRASAWEFALVVDLGELSPEWVRVELYAEPGEDRAAVRQAMTRETMATVASTTHRYTVSVPADRDAGEFTPRVIPRHADVLVPNEAPQIAWQH